MTTTGANDAIHTAAITVHATRRAGAIASRAER